MKYVNEVIIDKPIGNVIDLFDNLDNLKHWQPGFQKAELVSGKAGEPGAITRLTYHQGKKIVELYETITVKNLPEEFSGTYAAKGMKSTVRNFFIPLNEGKTKYISESEFELSGFLKVIGFLMPGSFKKHSLKYMLNFKKFVENS